MLNRASSPTAAKREFGRRQARSFRALQHIAALRGEADTAVWVGDCTLPPPNRGSEFSPFGSDAYVLQRLALKREEHDRLLQRVPSVQDLQAAWLSVLPPGPTTSCIPCPQPRQQPMLPRMTQR